jgi:outer membrane protein OmpA-like peptidoglycan-associated protein/tetratricopeptide (TPR) repeat protein
MSAQNVKFERANFSGKEDDLQKALMNIAQGEEFLFEAETMLSGIGVDIHYKAKAKEMISKGISYFLQANEFNPQSAQLNYTIGRAYFYIENYAKAEEFLKKAKSLDDQSFRDIDFFIGQIYQAQDRLHDAIERYEAALKRYNGDEHMNSMIATKIKECHFAQEMIQDAVDVLVDNLGVTINTATPEYLPIIAPEDNVLFFERFTSGESKIFASERDGSGWKQATATWQTFQLNDKEMLSQLVLVDKNGNPVMTKWFTVNTGQEINSSLYEALATVTADGSVAYFASNRYDGHGGFDIFVSQRNKKGGWDHPRNLGDEINTAGDEFGVALHPDGNTLFFSSNGHTTMGGFDIFKSEYDGKHWGTPVNLGYPINSTSDDIIYSISEDGNRLFFSSGRVGGQGKEDIYMVDFMSGAMPERPIPIPQNVTSEAAVIRDDPAAGSTAIIQYPAALRGFVTDKTTYMPLANMKLRLLDKSTNIEEVIETDNKGTFYATLSAGGSYRITMDNPGYELFVDDFMVSNEQGQKLSKYMNLTPISSIMVADVTEQDEPVMVAAVEEQQPKASTNEEDYEDILVLSPIVAAEIPEEPVDIAPKEHPISFSGLVSDNTTFDPLSSVMMKVVVKGTVDENVYFSDAQGRFDFKLASGNIYTLIVEAPGYRTFVEEIIVPSESNQKMVRSIPLTPTFVAVVDSQPEVSTTEDLQPVEVAVVVPEEIDEEPVIEEPVAADAPKVLLTGFISDNVTYLPLTATVILEAKDTTIMLNADHKGSFETNLPYGDYTVIVEASGYELYQDRVTISETIGEKTMKSIQLTAVAPAIVVADVVEPEPVVEDPVPETQEAENISYEEDITILAPVVETEVKKIDKADSVVVKEHLVKLHAFVSDNYTYQPLDVSVKLAAENSVMDETFQTSEKGMLEVTVLSGNTYTLTVEAPGYEPVVDKFEIENIPGQTITRNIFLTSLTPPPPPPPPVADVVEIVESKPEIELPAEPVKIPVKTETPVVTPPVVGQVEFAGTVTRTDKKPVSSATVTLTNYSHLNVLPQQMTTDSKGTFKVNATAKRGDKYSFTVSANDYPVYVKDIVTSSLDKKLLIPIYMRIEEGSLITNIKFDFDRAALSDKGKAELDKLMPTFKQEGTVISVTGYTDNAGGRGYNIRLAERRAEAISTYLRINGVPENNIKTLWKGLEDQTATNFTIEGRKANNRVEIRVK